MNTLEFSKQYQNNELCQKWNNNIPAKELDYPFQFATDSQDIEYICMLFPFLPKQDITGILEKVGDGDFDEIYITESSNPYMLAAIYHPLSYYVK